MQSDDGLMESPPGGSGRHSGRVRKKSAKVLEMEEFEGLEKKSHGKPSTPKVPGAKIKQKVTVVKSMLSPVADIASNPSAIQNILNSPFSGGAILQDSPVKAQTVASIIADQALLRDAEIVEPIKLNLSNIMVKNNPLASPPENLPPPPPSKNEKKMKAKTAKKSAESLPPMNFNKSPTVREELKLKAQQKTATIDSPLSEAIAIKQEMVMVGTVQENVKSPSDFKLAEDSFFPAAKKIKFENDATMTGVEEQIAEAEGSFESELPQEMDTFDAPLLIAEKKPKKSKTKAISHKQNLVQIKNEPDVDEPDEDLPAEGDVEVKVEPGLVARLHTGSSASQKKGLHEMAMKVRNSLQKAGKPKSRPKNPNRLLKSDLPTKVKRKRRKGHTAYMLWCNSKRGEVVASHPGIEFAEISRRLGEMWQSTPEKEKTNWRRKAKRLANKKAMLAASGKTHEKASNVKYITQGKKLESKANPQFLAPPPLQGSLVRHGEIINVTPQYKAVGCESIDVAAHLKLLGESLAIIGARLQEHRGHIAVQGTLSVLLDSMICALGPLMCLTNQIPDLDGTDPQVHLATLDNIAYFMPGIG